MICQIGESCDPAIRGILGSLPSILMSLGILCAYIIGSVARWDTLALFCSGMTLFVGAVMFTMPESPVWLRSKNRHHDADQSIKWLKLQTAPIQLLSTEEMAMAAALLDETREKEIGGRKFRDVVFTRPLMMPLFIGLMLLVLQQISGIDAIIFFTVEIFRESGTTESIYGS